MRRSRPSRPSAAPAWRLRWENAVGWDRGGRGRWPGRANWPGGLWAARPGGLVSHAGLGRLNGPGAPGFRATPIPRFRLT
jgi:hypothetical protein